MHTERELLQQAAAHEELENIPYGHPRCFNCVMGLAVQPMPNTLRKAWRLGLNTVTTTAVTGNLSRYLFLALQSLLIFVGLVFSYFANDVSDIGSDMINFVRIGCLGMALLINFVERFMYWCLHALSNRSDDGSWNFYSDIVRLFLTEFFIYPALVLTMYGLTSTHSYQTYFSDIPRKNASEFERDMVFGLSLFSLIGVTFILTAGIMRNFLVYSIARTLLNKRQRNISQAGRTIKCFLSGLRLQTTLGSIVQFILLAFIGLLLHPNDLPDRPVYLVVFAVLTELVPVAAWFLYFVTVQPWVEEVPIATLLDSHSTRAREQQINMTAVSAQFRALHGYNTSTRGRIINVLRPFGSPLQGIAHMTFFACGGYVLFFLTFTVYFPASSLLFVIVGSVAIVLVLVLSILVMLYGLFTWLFSPVLLPLYLTTCLLTHKFNSHEHTNL